MRRLRVLGVGALGVLALLTIAAGPVAAQAIPGGYFGSGTFGGSASCPPSGVSSSFGASPVFGACPSFGVPPDPCLGFSRWPAFSACPGLGVSPGFGAFPSFGARPSLGAFPQVAPAAAPAAPAQRVRLAMRDNFFYPAEISVPVGTQVAWLNEGSVPHTTTLPGVWDSGAVAPGGRWAGAFAAAGTFDYFCTLHPEVMQGRLTVTLP